MDKRKSSRFMSSQRRSNLRQKKLFQQTQIKLKSLLFKNLRKRQLSIGMCSTNEIKQISSKIDITCSKNSLNSQLMLKNMTKFSYLMLDVALEMLCFQCVRSYQI